jgi:hypothetical protein
MAPRCPNGTRRNKKTGNCEKKNATQKRCPKGTRKNKKTGLCKKKIEMFIKEKQSSKRSNKSSSKKSSSQRMSATPAEMNYNNAFESYLSKINPELLIADIKTLKTMKKDVIQKIKHEIQEEKNASDKSLTKEQKKKVREYKKELETHPRWVLGLFGLSWTEDEPDESKLYLDMIEKFASNTTGNDKYLRTVELKELLSNLQSSLVDFDDKNDYYNILGLLILTHYK